MYDPAVIVLDVVVSILAIMCAYISIAKISLISRGNHYFGWWWILPIIMVWTACIRFLYVLVAIDIIPASYTPWVTASQIVFYVGLTVFLWDLYRSARSVLGP